MDSLQAVIAELRRASDKLPVMDATILPAIAMHAWADRLERIDAETRLDMMLVEYINLCDIDEDNAGDRCDVIWDALGADRQHLARVYAIGHSHKELTATCQELRERLAAAEKDADRYRYIQRTGFTPPNDRFGRVLFGDKLGAWIDGRKSPPDAIAAEAREEGK